MSDLSSFWEWGIVRPPTDPAEEFEALRLLGPKLSRAQWSRMQELERILDKQDSTTPSACHSGECSPSTPHLCSFAVAPPTVSDGTPGVDDDFAD